MMDAETVVRPTTLRAERPVAALAAASVALVLLVVVFLLVGGPAIELVGCVVAGFGITYLCGVDLKIEERLSFGAVIGAMAVASASFIVSMVVRDVTVLTVSIGLAVALTAGAGGAIAERDRLMSDLADAAARWWRSPRTAGHPWPFAAVVVVCGAWTLHFLSQAYVYKADGLWEG